MTFRIPTHRTTKPGTPEDVFRTLKNRAHDIKHLWSHQADLLRAYAEAGDVADIALELATGAGKSLIGLLIAEYRRQARDERVAYLCPTRQLAHQLNERARSYGIPTVVLVGSQGSYSPGDFTAYNRAQKIAVTTYSAIFNTNPRIDNAECLLLDDAHAGESYIAKLWSVRIRREERPVYDAIINLFADRLPEALVFHVTDDRPASGEQGGVGTVVAPLHWERSGRLREILTAGATSSDYAHSWSIISPHLDACALYISWSEILIRPLFPPSLTHAAFAGAKQRVYMSATLGSGGDLERATGVAKIHRLPPPAGWDKQGTGRRLILFPDLSLSPEETSGLVSSVVGTSERVLVLTTDGRRAEHIKRNWLTATGKVVLGASDIEEDLRVFAENPNAALLLTNRYDGLDLPDDACRMLIVDELPDATNLQERFLTQRLGANAFLRERIRTRVTQALGRCTRNDADYATVFVLGARASNFLAQREVLRALHPELQAEIEFGLENSADQSVDGFKELVRAFQGPQWLQVEEHLASARTAATRVDDPVAGPLRRTVADELAYVYAAWAGNWPEAFKRAGSISDALDGGVELKPYRALWYALGGFAAQRAEPGEGTTRTSNALLQRAATCAPAWIWFLRAAATSVAAAKGATPDDALVATATTRAAEYLASFGAVGSRFDRSMNELRASLSAREARPFERGLATLGRLLGFEVLECDAHERAAPDSVWNLESEVVIGWEAKSDEEPDRPIPIRDVREANGHFDWIRHRLKLGSDNATTVVLASPRSTLDPDARKFAERLRYAHVSDVEALAQEVVAVLSTVRRTTGAAGGEVLQAELQKAFTDAHLLPSDLRERFDALVRL